MNPPTPVVPVPAPNKAVAYDESYNVLDEVNLIPVSQGNEPTLHVDAVHFVYLILWPPVGSEFTSVDVSGEGTHPSTSEIIDGAAHVLVTSPWEGTSSVAVFETSSMPEYIVNVAAS